MRHLIACVIVNSRLERYIASLHGEMDRRPDTDRFVLDWGDQMQHILIPGRMRPSLTRVVAAAVMASLLFLVGNVARADLTWNQFDVVTRGNFSSSSDVEGYTLAGGNVSGSWTGSTQQSALGSTPTVYIGGTFSGNLNLNKGSVRIANSSDVQVAHTNFNGGGGYIYDNSSGAGNSIANTISTVIGQLSAANAAFGGLTANNSVTIANNTATFNAITTNSQGLAVFSVTTTQLAGWSQIDLHTVAAGVKGIVIDVTAGANNQTTLTETANFTGNWSSSNDAMTMWNFGTNITSISANTSWQGSVIALGATLTNANSMNGGVYVNSLIGNGEVHLPLYDGPVPTAVPEPSSALVAVFGTAAAGLLAWRRRMAARAAA
jgi:choice-of-anchor A domain-containing protein